MASDPYFAFRRDFARALCKAVNLNPHDVHRLALSLEGGGSSGLIPGLVGNRPRLGARLGALGGVVQRFALTGEAFTPEVEAGGFTIGKAWTTNFAKGFARAEQ